MTREARPQSPPFFQRLAHALPDAMTAGIFLYAWLAPLHWRKTLVADLMLVMLIEFVLIHSAPFLGSVVLASDAALRNRLAALAGLTAFYSLFIGGFALAFKAWWPVIAFAWLIIAKLITVATNSRHTPRQKRRMYGYWVVSAGFYLFAGVVTSFIPLPEFGITQHGATYGISGSSGAWVSHPHTAIAAGFLYFGLLAATKLAEQPTWWRNMKVNRAEP